MRVKHTCQVWWLIDWFTYLLIYLFICLIWLINYFIYFIANVTEWSWKAQRNGREVDASSERSMLSILCMVLPKQSLDIVRNCRLFCIQSLCAYACLSTVTLINLPFTYFSIKLPTVLVEISPRKTQPIPTNRHFFSRCERPVLLFRVYSAINAGLVSSGRVILRIIRDLVLIKRCCFLFPE